MEQGLEMSQQNTSLLPRIGFWGRSLQAFIVLMPFLHALGLSAWLPLPLFYAIIMLVIGLLGLFFSRLNAFWLVRSDLALIGAFICGVMALVYYWDYAGTKNLNHAIALLVSVALFYIWMRTWIWRAKISFKDLGVAAVWGLLISSTAIIFEFFSANFYGFYLADIIPYSVEELPFALVLNAAYQRPRGLSAEPGFSAMVFEALVPMAAFYLRRHTILALAFTPVILTGFILLFSAGAIMAMTLAAILVMLNKMGGLKWTITMIFGIVPLVGLLLFVPTANLFFADIIGRKVLDLFVEGGVNAGEMAGRYQTYRAGVEIFLNAPFGIGWGMISQIFDSGITLPNQPFVATRGLLSLYGEILVSAGVIGFLMYGIFHVGRIRAAQRLSDPEKPFILFGLFALTIHHAIVLEFWFPMLWFYFALITTETRRNVWIKKRYLTER